MYKGVGVSFADFISFSSISHENEIIWSHRYSKTGAGRGV